MRTKVLFAVAGLLLPLLAGGGRASAQPDVELKAAEARVLEKVKSALMADKQLDAADIRAVYLGRTLSFAIGIRGHVDLQGTVRSRAEKKRAEEIAQKVLNEEKSSLQVVGVDIQNYLVVKEASRAETTPPASTQKPASSSQQGTWQGSKLAWDDWRAEHQALVTAKVKKALRAAKPLDATKIRFTYRVAFDLAQNICTDASLDGRVRSLAERKRAEAIVEKVLEGERRATRIAQWRLYNGLQIVLPE